MEETSVKKEVARDAFSLSPYSLCKLGSLNLHMHDALGKPQRALQKCTVEPSSEQRELQWLVRFSGSDVPQKKVTGP